MTGYVDGFVLPVPKSKLKIYRKMAGEAAKVWKKHGALEYFECAGDDLSPDMGGMKIARFPKMARAKPNETVVFAFIVFKSRVHRDSVNRKVMKDMKEWEKKSGKKMEMPFDVKRMAYGGFRTLVKS
jgi:uncharacterized protein YbaA (DUF1428 family)